MHVDALLMGQGLCSGNSLHELCGSFGRTKTTKCILLHLSWVSAGLYRRAPISTKQYGMQKNGARRRR